MSDQDFFFEDDDKPADKSAPKGKKTSSQPARPANKGASRPPAAPSDGGSGQSVTLTMAILFATIGLLLGVVIGLFIGNVASPAVPAAVTAPAGQVAPTLTDEQINGGALPPGHPSVGGTGTAPSAPATK